MNLSNPFWPKHHFVFKVGGVFLPDPIAGKVFDSAHTSAGPSPIDSLPVPTPNKPISPTDPSIIQAESDFAKENLLKKSIKKTVFAGDTGGFNQSQPNAAGLPNPVGSYRGRNG